eukprot:1294165-Amphidinium_carterae.1
MEDPVSKQSVASNNYEHTNHIHLLTSGRGAVLGALLLISSATKLNALLSLPGLHSTPASRHAEPKHNTDASIWVSSTLYAINLPIHRLESWAPRFVCYKNHNHKLLMKLKDNSQTNKALPFNGARNVAKREV